MKTSLKEKDVNDEKTININNNKSNIKDEDYNKIELLPTFNKISLSQALLKEMISKKELFEENKNKMLDTIKSYNYKYFKNIILSKEIYDNCKLRKDIKEHQTYKISNDPSKKIKKSIFPKVSKFLFLIRNNNNYMMKILNGTHNRYIKEVSYFLCHLFYENTITNDMSFISKELQLIIYLQMEKIINKNSSEILLYNKDTFLFRLIEALIRKPSIKYYLDILLKDLIIDIDKKEKMNKLNLKTKKENSKNNDSGKIKRSLADLGKLKTEANFLKKHKAIQSSFLFDKKEFKKPQNNIKEKEINKNKDKNNFNNIYNEFNDVDSKFIFDKLTNLKKDENLYIALNYIYSHHFSKVATSNNAYNFVINEIYEKESENNKDEIFQKLKSKYEIVKYFIVKLIEKIEQNINNLPKSIQYIMNIAGILIEKKWIKKEKPQKLDFLKIMSKIKILLGNIILRKIQYLSSKKIIGDFIISEEISEHLKIIKKIFENIIVGNLFDKNKDPEYTIYNRLIIDLLPKIMNIAMLINSNGDGLKDENYIFDKLINSFQNNYEDDKRIINYEELIEPKKDDEKIKYQSICFNLEIAYILIKSIDKDKKLFINQENDEKINKIFEDILKIEKDLFVLFKRNESKEFFIIDRVSYQKDFEEKINSIIQENFETVSNKENFKEISIFKKCLSELLGRVGILNKENFIFFIRPKEEIQLHSNKKIKSFFNSKLNDIYSTKKFETQTQLKTVNTIDDENKTNNIIKTPLKYSNSLKIKNRRISISIKDKDKFFMRRQSVVLPFFEIEINDDKKDELDFQLLIKQIISKIKIEYGSFTNEKTQRILFSLSYILSHYNNLPIEYRKNNYSKIFTEIIQDTKCCIEELQNNLLNEFYNKIRYSEKINEIMNKNYTQMKNIEKLFYIKFLYQNIKVLVFIIKEMNHVGKIMKIKYEPSDDQNNEFIIKNISSFIEQIPNFEDKFLIDMNKDILTNEKETGLIDTINNYFQEMKNNINKENILSKLFPEESLQIIYGLESFILKELYPKIYPKKPNKEDIFLYKKCHRLSFLKPPNIIKDKKFLNIKEKSLEISVQYIKDMDNEKSPMDILNLFGKANSFLLNSMEFNTGKSDFGIDDLLPLQIFIMIKAEPKMLNTNYNFCMMYLNKDLMKKQFGSYMTQFGMIMNIIKNMKYSDLNNVSEKEFGNDEVI